MTSPLWLTDTDGIPFAALGEGAQVHAPIVVMRPEMVSIGQDARIDSFVKLEGGEGLTIGAYVHVGSFCHLGIGAGWLEIGEGAGIGGGVKVLSGSNTEEGYYMSAAAPEEMQVKTRAHTVIERGAFIGTGAIILPGVRIGEFAVIAAGAVVTKDVPARQVWAGTPARFLRKRRQR